MSLSADQREAIAEALYDAHHRHLRIGPAVDAFSPVPWADLPPKGRGYFLALTDAALGVIEGSEATP